MLTMPASSLAATVWAFRRSFVQIPAYSPNAVSFAAVTRSSTEANALAVRTGPKISSRPTTMSEVTPSNSAGETKFPFARAPSPTFFPPTRSLAPPPLPLFSYPSPPPPRPGGAGRPPRRLPAAPRPEARLPHALGDLLHEVVVDRLVHQEARPPPAHPPGVLRDPEEDAPHRPLGGAESRERSDSGRLQDGGVPRRDGRGDPAHGEGERVVPGGDVPRDPDGLAQGVVQAVPGDGDRAALDLVREPGVVLEELVHVRCVALRLAERLPHVEALELRELLEMIADLLGHLIQDPPALAGVHPPPLGVLEGVAGILHGEAHVLLGR